MMLATALVTVSSSAVAYDHNDQSSVFADQLASTAYEQMQQTTHTSTVNPQTGMIYNDQD